MAAPTGGSHGENRARKRQEAARVFQCRNLEHCGSIELRRRAVEVNCANPGNDGVVWVALHWCVLRTGSPARRVACACALRFRQPCCTVGPPAAAESSLSRLKLKKKLASVQYIYSGRLMQLQTVDLSGSGLDPRQLAGRAGEKRGTL